MLIIKVQHQRILLINTFFDEHMIKNCIFCTIKDCVIKKGKLYLEVKDIVIKIVKKHFILKFNVRHYDE